MNLARSIMPNHALLFARTLQDADNSALVDWKWDRTGELRPEWRRPDTGERVRFVPDSPGTLQGLRWNTRIYLGYGVKARADAELIRAYVLSGFFKLCDPELPPPRRRPRRDEALDEVRKQLARLERRT